jgi:D-threonate/D-erythronate kinase
VSDILILADDLTGAADTGAQFALSGCPTLLLLEPDLLSSPSVLVLTSESRGLKGSRATAAVRSTLAELAVLHPLDKFPVIYKKIDSTLRGNPAEELEVLLALSNEQRVLVAPAYPAQGRTTRNGVIWVYDKPLARTSFAVEAGNGDLRQLFGANALHLPLEIVRQDDTVLKSILRNHQGPVLADSENDHDLFVLARAAFSEGIRVYCGSAGLAGAVTRLPLWSHHDAYDPAININPEWWQKPKIIFAVAGSLHSSTRDQVAFAQQHGIEVITPPKVFFQDSSQAGVAETAQHLASFCIKGIPAILSTRPQESNRNYLSGPEIASKLAQVAVSNIPQGGPLGLFLTGGETALAVCHALGIKKLWLGGEVEPGMPWSHSDHHLFVTKAGAFGREDALMKGINWLQTSAPDVTG